MASEPDAPRPDHRAGDYRAARIGAAAALIGVLVVLLLLDPFLPDYEMDPLQLVSLLGFIAALLGIEVKNMVMGR